VPEYRLIFHRKAEKFLDGLDEKTKQGLLEDILCLADFTGLKGHLDIVKLKGQKGFTGCAQANCEQCLQWTSRQEPSLS